jgi:serine/threonine protein kinase
MFQDEFLEMDVLASGHFGDVMKARHRLDGVVYAIKIIKKRLRPNSMDERIALNEVFANVANSGCRRRR